MRRFLRAAGSATLTAGVVCQFVQHTDPTPPLAYFTVWSAIFGALVLALAAFSAPSLPAAIRGAATVGCVVSGLIFAAVITPATPTGTWTQPGDDGWVRTANVMLHGIGPVLIAAEFAITPIRVTRPWCQAGLGCIWPAVYIVAAFSLQAADVTPVPYPFLNPSRSAPEMVAVAVVGLVGVFLVTGRILVAVNSLACRQMRVVPA